MFKKILYPTDFSDRAQRAVEYVKRLKDAGTEEVILIHVLDERELRAMGEGATWAGKDLEQFLRETREGLKEEAKRKLEGVSLIVIGSHGKSMVKEMLLGSVSEKVARKAKQPVLIVKE